MEIKDGLLLLYVVMVAAFLEPLFSCDLQRLFTESVLTKHFILIISIFFVITLTDDKNEARSLTEMFQTTAKIYVLYVASIKSKAPFVLLMLATLAADQVLRVQVNILDKRAEENTARDGDAALKGRLVRVRATLTWAIVALIAVGLAHYYVRARREFGADFRAVTFFLGTKQCARAPRA